MNSIFNLFSVDAKVLNLEKGIVFVIFIIDSYM